MNGNHPTLTELQLHALKRSRTLHFEWDLLDAENGHADLVDGFLHAVLAVGEMEANYTQLLAGTYPTSMPEELQTPATSADHMSFLQEDLVATYILLELAERYAAIEAITSNRA